MIKILYIIDTLEGYGAEKSIVEIATGFSKIKPVFVHIYQGDMLKADLEHAGIKVYSLDLNKKYGFNQALEKLIPIYQKERPDIVHATLFRSEIIARKLKAKFPGVILLGSFVSNPYSSERLKKKSLIDRLKLNYFYRLDKKTAGEVDYFISNSHVIKKQTCKELEVDLEKVKVIHRGRDSAKFNPEKKLEKFPFLKSNKTVLLNVSRLIQLKGQEDLIRALPEVLKYYNNISLVFAGHGSYRENLEKLVDKLKIGPYVQFLGRIDNINELLLNTDIFLYPSYSEGLPGALIEAMLSGKIIICSDIPENLECVDKSSALIYEKGNISELAETIINVLNNPDNFKSYGENARKRAIAKFELKDRIFDYENFYFDINRRETKKNLRILHLIQKPQNRGAETFACQLANHQINLGNQVKIISVFSGIANLPWNEYIESLEASSNSRFFDFKAWRKLSKIIEDFKPDIVQANAGDTLKYAVFSKQIYNWQTPIVFRNASEVGRYLKSKFQKNFNKFLYSKVNQVISVSELSKNDITTNFPSLKNKTVSIPIGIEQNGVIIPKDLNHDGIQNIIHVGGFTFEKNHEGLINIFKGVLTEKPNTILHLVGDGPKRTEIERLINAEGLTNKVHFHGFVTDPLAYIKAADVLALPSIIEGLPGVLLEAMYCETPVVAYNVGGVSEVLNSNTGKLIHVNDESKFIAAILEVLNNPNKCIIDNARERVESKYLNSAIAKRFQDAYYYNY
jgi:L-malate glycosyltransferase